MSRPASSCQESASRSSSDASSTGAEDNGGLSYYEDLTDVYRESSPNDDRPDSNLSYERIIEDGNTILVPSKTPPVNQSPLEELLYLTEGPSVSLELEPASRAEFKQNQLKYNSMQSIPENERVKFRQPSASSYPLSYESDITAKKEEKASVSSSSKTASSKVSTAFFEAAEKGDVANVKKLLDEHPNLNPDNKRKYKDRTALHQAAGYGQLQVVGELLSVGADPEYISESGTNALHEACQGGHGEVLQKLLDFTRSVNVQDKQGQSPAHVAANHGEVKCLDVLVEKGADLELEDLQGRQPIHLAAKNNHREVIEYLYGKGLSLQCPDNILKLPIHYAAQYGSIKALQCLIERECDITLPDKQGNLPLHLAVLNNNLDCVRFLATQGSSLLSKRTDGRQPIHLAASKGSTEVLHWLGGHPTVDIYCQDKYGNTPLHLAALGGHNKAFHCLLQHDADLQIENDKHDKPMDSAKKSGHKLSMEKALRSEEPCPLCLHQHDVIVFQEATGPAPIARIVARSAGRAFTNPIAPTPSLTRNYFSKTMYKLPLDKPKGNAKQLPARGLAAQYFGNHLESRVKNDY